MGNHAKLNYIHIFRAIAIIIIVLGHSVDTSHEIMGILVNIFIQGGTVLFVFISGFLFFFNFMEFFSTFSHGIHNSASLLINEINVFFIN